MGNIRTKLKYPNLLAEMARRGETNYDIAKVINKSYAAVTRRINGKTLLSIEDINLICKHYNKTYEELFK